MKTTANIETIKNLKRQHKTEWLKFSAKLDAMLLALGNRTGTGEWGSDEDITEFAIADDFVAAGFSADEADAMIFVLTQDSMGRAVNSVEMILRWFSYECR